MPQIEHCIIKVNQTPYVYFDYHLHHKNVEFLQSIDSEYFKNLAEVHEKLLEGDLQQYAAITLRKGYFHGLETFFSLLFGTLQAPYSVISYMHYYKRNDLIDIIDTIKKGFWFFSIFNIDTSSWLNLVNFIHNFEIDNEEMNLIKSEYAKLWSNYSEDYQQIIMNDEYNSIKHGMRLSPGGFNIGIGLQKMIDDPAPPENMTWIKGGKFGSRFYSRRVIAKKKNGINPEHFTLRQNNINWDPMELAEKIKLLSQSIHNVKTFALYYNEVDKDTLKYQIPDNIDQFKIERKYPYTAIESWAEVNVIPGICPVFTFEEVNKYFLK